MSVRYANRYFSILGDSISTLDGYSYPADAVFYSGINKLKADVYAPEDTWWGKVIDALQGRLLVNDSFSGSMVTKRPSSIYPSHGCSDERTGNLQKNGQVPDVIMVYMGTNDWGCGAEPKPGDPAQSGDLAVFSEAYACMLQKLRDNYPNAEIWCFTLAVSKYSARSDFAFPYRYRTHHIEEYCNVIRECAEAFGCRLIDLYGAAEPYDTIDGFHPNAEGMSTLAKAAVAQIFKE